MALERATDPDAIAAARELINERITAAGGDSSAVTVVAVTKTFGIDTVRAAVAAGCRTLGENYAAELVEKASATTDLGIAWHFLGALQTNKIGRLAPLTSCFESVSREREAEAIALRRPEAHIMVQVDFTNRVQRNGATTEEVEGIVDRAQTLGLVVDGLMTVAPPESDSARRAFRTLKTLADGLGLSECSMGMTDDLEIAVEEGTTMIRVGRALFGGRDAAK